MRYTRETSASVTEIMQRARESFGSTGLGLQQAAVGMLESSFVGELGGVDVVVRPVRPGVNEVEAASQAFDGEVARFIRDLPRVSAFSQFRRWMRSKIRPRVKP